MGRGQIERKVDGMWLINGESERGEEKNLKKKRTVFSMHKKTYLLSGYI